VTIREGFEGEVLLARGAGCASKRQQRFVKERSERGAACTCELGHKRRSGETYGGTKTAEGTCGKT